MPGARSLAAKGDRMSQIAMHRFKGLNAPYPPGVEERTRADGFPGFEWWFTDLEGHCQRIFSGDVILYAEGLRILIPQR